ncbi:amidohydrolase family protein [Parasphingorhabdus sp. JC815]|uniref:amidohydrolase family protein n=1 Tax=Parasphingorhabdus sp. JC815 TaxID=3232140 RepID=UPI00345AFB81
MIIDAWGQHPTLRHSQDSIFASLRRWTKTEEPTQALPIEATIAAMDQGNIDKMLISAWYAPNKIMISNDEVAEFVEASDGRFVGVGSVDISKPSKLMTEVRRCVEELGFKAMRVLPWLWETAPTDRRFYPLYVACCELGIPFCTQIGHTGPLMPSEPGRPLYLDQVALDFPELKIVAGHIGYPWTQEAIAVSTKHQNVYIDTSAYTVSRYPAELIEYMRGHGRKKILFGTNYPMITPSRALTGLDDLELDSETKNAFLGGNAQHVFNL